MDESQVRPYRRPAVSELDEVFASIWQLHGGVEKSSRDSCSSLRLPRYCLFTMVCAHCLIRTHLMGSDHSFASLLRNRKVGKCSASLIGG